MKVLEQGIDAATGEPFERWIDIPDAQIADAAAKQATADQAEANGRTLAQKAEQYLTDSAAFLALASPSNAQTLAQVKQNTRAIRGLVRLYLRKLDSTD